MGILIGSLILLWAQGAILMFSSYLHNNEYKVNWLLVILIIAALIWPITIVAYKLITLCKAKQQ